MLRYEEGRCIGRGSYGSAHLVTERASGARYVIKKIPMELLSDSEKQQSFREVELLAKLKHPNVVEYKESFVDKNVIHIVMAYCDGGDLAGRIKERAAISTNGGHGYFDTKQILDWFVQMVMAIKYLHEQRILHRDLKTSNIFLTTENVIKLGDFGIAKTLDSTLDQAKTVVGTPYYMSPEVCESKPYSYASDVWSLGCVFYEIVALKHAFDAPNILTLILKIVQNEFAAVPAHYDPEISDILKRLLDKQPERRPTMDQILLMPYIRNHMHALVEAGSLKVPAVARRPHGTPKRRAHTKNGRRSSCDPSSKGRRGGSSTPNRWAAITPNDREEVFIGEGSDLELLEASGIMDESSLDIRLPERSRTPEPLVAGAQEEPSPSPVFERQKPSAGVRPSPLRKKGPPVNAIGAAWVEQPRAAAESPTSCRFVVARRLSADEVEEELDSRFQVEAAEALMNPNFQRVYAEECDDSLTVKYAPQSKGRTRHPHRGPSSNGKPHKAEVVVVDNRRRVFDLPAREQQSAQYRASGPQSRQPQPQPQHWGVTPRQSSATDSTTLTLSLSLDDSAAYESEHLDASVDAANLSDSGMLRQLEMEEASSSDENDEDAYSSNSDGYDGEENFYSEHSAYSDDSDFAGEENEAEYSDDFEELDGEVIDYANDDFVPEDEGPQADSIRGAPTGLAADRTVGIKSPKLASSPASRRPPREVQWVMRNVAQSLMESCENLSVA